MSVGTAEPARVPGPGTDLIRRRKLSDEVAARIEAMIQDGRYTTGDQLPSERDLMELFGVGRPSVREAMFSLQKMGLIAVSNGERARVTAPSAQVLVGELSGAARHLLARPGGTAQFQQARAFLEVALARYAARHATQAQVERLGAALEANRRAVGDAEAFKHTDVAFHQVLAEIPGNPIFTALCQALAEWLVEQRTVSMRAAGSPRAAHRAHQRIHDAVAAHDADAAERAMEAHLGEVQKFYWQVAGVEAPRASASRKPKP